MSAKDPFSILFKETNNKPITAAEEKAKKIERYRPGKVPEWEEPQEEETLPMPNPLKTIEIDEIKVPDLCIFAENPHQVAEDASNLQPKKVSSMFLNQVRIDSIAQGDFKSPDQVKIRAKPVFVSKKQRVTHAEREQKEKEEQELIQELKILQEEKKTRTKIVVAEAIYKEEIQNIESDPETSSSSEAEDAFAQWKIREIKRIMRDKECQEQRSKEMAEIERRRTLTDWERQEEDKKLGNDAQAKPEKQKIQFMQKYYNKGVYFQERDEHGKLREIFMRDYNRPVEGDFDKTNLPRILQKRRGDFGKKGQSKYTHLTNEDTTNFDPLYMPQPELLMKQQMKGAAYKSMNTFDARAKNHN